MSLSSVFKNADLITSLPTDDSETSPKEKGILDMLYPSNTSIANSNTVVNNQSKEKPAFRFKDIIVASFVFVLLNMPVTDRILERYIKTTNDYYRLSIKTILFFILLFVINNFILKNTNF